MEKTLNQLRDSLCKSATEFCRDCFTNSRFAHVQNPPNIFRAGRNKSAKIVFIFDKPNNNDAYRSSANIPITICGPARPGIPRSPTHSNLIRLLYKLGFIDDHDAYDPLDSALIHFTNAVKCDKDAATGQTGGVMIGTGQVNQCVSRFLMTELALIKPSVLVFFGENAQRYVLGYLTPPGEPRQAVIGAVNYWILRVPHTTAQSFNTHGKGGEFYIEPFRQLLTSAGLV